MLKTKLHRPPVTKEHVYRDHLIDLLDKNMYKPVSLVSAGAGYGKSMLISSWLGQVKTPYAWVSLSKDDNDFRSFIRFISTSVRKIFPAALAQLISLLEAVVLPPTQTITESFINGLDEIDREFVLVLDDYHLIYNDEINELINSLLHFPPQLMHLVIITRMDPFLNLSDLRAHSRIHEIRMADLCFNEEDIIVLFEHLFDTSLSPKIAKKLRDRTEGWITGLRLASLLVRKEDDVNEAFKNIQANTPTTANFLLKEVIQNQPEHIQNCLIRISILDRFCDELVEALCLSKSDSKGETISGNDFIQFFEEANLFTISLDHERKWYRFHHLFQELLQDQLKKQNTNEEIRAYHSDVSAWFDHNDLKEEAVAHAIKADDLRKAVDLVSSYRYELMETGQIHRLNQLVDLLPDSIIEENPVLLTTKSLIMEYRGQIADWIDYKEKAKALLSKMPIKSQEENAIRGEIETIEGELFLLSGDGESAFECSRKAIELLPVTASYALSYAWGTQIISYQLVDNIEGLDKISIENIQDSDFFLSRIQGWYCIAYAMHGDTGNLTKYARKFIDLSAKQHLSESVVYGKYFLSVTLYLSMEDDQAVPYLQSVVNDPFLSRPHYLANCAFILSSIYIDKGEKEKADQLMDSIIRHTEEAQDILVTKVAKAMRVEIALKGGYLEKAILLNDHQDSYAFYPPIWFIYVSQLTPVKLKLVINTAESIEEALQMLSEIEGQLRQSNKKTILIDVLILQTAALIAKENEKEARLKIIEALSLSNPGNCIRTYVDYGNSLQKLLTDLLKTSEFSTHIRNILNAIALRKNSFTLYRQPKNEVSLYSNPTLETLSNRELEVLKLVALGLRNKEISDQLFIQENTVKQHMKNIFSKLNVPNRISAVVTAEELGLINKEG